MPGDIPRGTLQANAFSFRGLVNVADPGRYARGGANGFSLALEKALNIDLDDEGKQTKAPGFALLASGAYKWAYATRDASRCYAVKGTDLVRFWPDGTDDVLQSGLASTRMHFVEAAGTVYAANGAQALVLPPRGGVRAWGQPLPAAPLLTTFPGTLPAGRYQFATATVASGVESGISQPASVVLDGTQAVALSGLAAGSNVYASSTDADVLYELFASVAGTAATWNGPVSALRDPVRVGRWSAPPAGASLPALHAGRMYLAQDVAGTDASAVWFSQPLGYEHFDQARDFFLVPGSVRMLAGTSRGLVVGTDRAVHSFTESGGIDQDTSPLGYGVVDGATAYPAPELEDTDDEPALVYFWTEQGVCRALPFANLTAKDVSLAPGHDGVGIVVEQKGYSRYAVCVKRSGQARNTL